LSVYLRGVLLVYGRAMAWRIIDVKVRGEWDDDADGIGGMPILGRGIKAEDRETVARLLMEGWEPFSTVSVNDGYFLLLLRVEVRPPAGADGTEYYFPGYA
jgi:hypothetical protein